MPSVCHARSSCAEIAAGLRSSSSTHEMEAGPGVLRAHLSRRLDVLSDALVLQAGNEQERHVTLRQGRGTENVEVDAAAVDHQG